MSKIIDNIKQVQQKINLIANQAARNAQSVHLLAVSKTKSAEDIRNAFSAGQIDFGENYLQEALQKQQQLNDLSLTWHFIGPIQSRKAKDIAKHFKWVHSVDRIKIATLLSNHRAGEPEPLQICIQVNISDEQTKSGCQPDELLSLAQSILLLPNITLRGLMAIPEPTSDKIKQHATFAKLRELKDQLNQTLSIELDTLSMGMSEDMDVAIAEGATWIRIGTAIFGERTYKTL